MSKLDIEKVAITHHMFDYHYQTYRVELELINCTEENILKWERFFSSVNDSKNNLINIIMEHISDNE